VREPLSPTVTSLACSLDPHLAQTAAGLVTICRARLIASACVGYTLEARFAFFFTAHPSSCLTT